MRKPGNHCQLIEIEDSNLPDWILIEILTRLPLKCIFRFKCVSKRWRSLISDSFFATSYKTKNNQTSSQPWSLLFRYLFEVNIPSYMINDRVAIDNSLECFSRPSFALNFLSAEQERRCPVKIMALSNGLLLCCSQIYWQKTYYVCNPLTAKYITLPEPPQTFRWVSVGFVTRSDGSYKVVRFPVDETPFPYGECFAIKLEVFDSESGSWLDLKVKCPILDYFIKTDSPVVTYRGFIHWQDFKQHKIMAYDPSNKNNEIVSMPLPEHRESRLQRVIGVSCGRLRYLEVTDDYLRPCNVSLWTLSDYEKGEWSLDHQTGFGDLWSDDDEIKRGIGVGNIGLFPLALHPLDVDVAYFWYERCLVLYDIKTRKLEALRRNVYSPEVLAFVLPTWPTQIPTPSW